MAKHVTISVDSAQYADEDDCLAAAAADYASEHPEARGYDMAPRWADDERDAILLDVPSAEGEESAMRGTLTDYRTGATIRPATAEEREASEAAAERDGGRGVITVDGRSCYVD